MNQVVSAEMVKRRYEAELSAQRHHEGVEPIGASVVRDEPEVPPVDLPLLERRLFQSELSQSVPSLDVAHAQIRALYFLCQDSPVPGFLHRACAR
jgi:hypothetical protein